MEPGRLVIPELTDGLGNRLFQLAAARGAATRWRAPLCFARDRIRQNSHGDTDTLLRLFPEVPVLHTAPDAHLCLEEPPRGFYSFHDLGESYPSQGPVILKGYWQSWKYNEIAPLNPDWHNALGAAVCSNLRVAAQLDDARERAHTWSLHVRLGDYTILPHHHINIWGYVSRALQRVPRGSRINLFSDDLDTAQQMLLSLSEGLGLELTWSTTKRDIDALYEMSLCHGGAIVANSTFSTWGAIFARQSCANPAGFRAFIPNSMGAGQPPPTDYAPTWMTPLPAL